MKATLYVFAYGGLTGITHNCVVSEARRWPELETGVCQDDALIDRARSNAATHFYFSGDDVMLMVDHDLKWKAGDLRYIAEKAMETKGVVAGIYPKRAFHQGQTFRIEEPCSFQIGEDRLIPARFVPTGFMAVHRNVMEGLVQQVPLVRQNFYPVFTPMIVQTEHGWEHLSEDWAFCQRAKAHPIHIAAKVKLEHQGSYLYRMVDSLTEPPSDEGLTVVITEKEARIQG